MSISYEDALATLQSMFAAPWTRDTLDAVLRHHNGHMENTVESILSGGSEDPQKVIDRLKSGAGSNQAALDEALARQLAQEEKRRSGGQPITTPSTQTAAAPAAAPVPAPAPAPPAKKGRGTPTNLPDDFLRIPGYTATPEPTLDADEALARMLQDELFSEELARNPDFAHLARGRPRTSGGLPTSNRAPNNAVPSRTAVPRRPSNEPNIMEKISELGETAKRRLQLLAAQFNATTNRKARPGQQTEVAAAAERRGLLDDDEEMELTFSSNRKDK